MKMAKKSRKRTPEERAEWEARHQRILAKLQERIDYYAAKIKAAEEHGQTG
jgi:hypothetical protein